MAATPSVLNRLRFDELAVFIQVAQAGSIAAASRRLGLPKSTVGRAISRLEEDFGVGQFNELWLRIYENTHDDDKLPIE